MINDPYIYIYTKEKLDELIAENDQTELFMTCHNISVSQTEPVSALQYLIDQYPAVLQYIIDQCSGSDLCNFFNLMHQACANGRIDIVECFTRIGVEVNIFNDKKHSRTFLCTAITHGRPSVVKLLLDAGAVVTDSAIIEAVCHRIEAGEIYLDLFIATGMDPHDICAVMLSSCSNNMKASLKKLADHGCDFTQVIGKLNC